MREPGERRGGLIVLFPFFFSFCILWMALVSLTVSILFKWIENARRLLDCLLAPTSILWCCRVLFCHDGKMRKVLCSDFRGNQRFAGEQRHAWFSSFEKPFFDPFRCWRIVLTSISTHDHAPSAIFPKRDGRSRTITFVRSRATWKEDRRKCVNGIGPAIYRTIVAKRSVEFRFVSVFPLIQARTFKCRNLPSSWKKEAWHNAYRLTGSGAEHERG